MPFFPVKSVKSLSQATLLLSVFFHAVFYPVSRSIFSQTSSTNHIPLALMFEKHIFSIFDKGIAVIFALD